jgi:hypothetical protein
MMYQKAEPMIGMSIEGLTLKLSSLAETIKGKAKKMVMPGAHGPYPAVSTGVHTMDIQESGKFIDMTGTIRLPFDAQLASWEIVWRENAVAGCLVCAAQLTKPVFRSNNPSATIPAGSIYLSFPIWKRSDLTAYQSRKAEVLAAAAKYLQLRDDELLKMQMTNNFLMKALHYRNAAAAVERYSLYPVHTMSSKVPDDTDVMPINETGDLLLTKVGTIWTNKKNKNNQIATTHSLLEMALTGPIVKKQILLGTAFIRNRIAPPILPTAVEDLNEGLDNSD